MKKEIVKKVEVLESGKLVLILQSEGQTLYQYIYREAAGVYWDFHLNGLYLQSQKIGLIRLGFSI